jgi:hypothetical protein
MPLLHLGFGAMVFWLLWGHCLSDFALQGDFLAMLKNHKHKVGEQYWAYGLFSHGMVHAGFVALFTGQIGLGLAEFVAHIAIDRAKCSGRLSFHVDQWLHYACKLLWAVLAVYVLKG